MKNSDGLQLVNGSLLKDIYGKRATLELLREEGMYSMPANYDKLQVEASKKSAEIELVGVPRSRRRLERRQYFKNLRNAIDFGKQDYSGVLTAGTILALGEIIDPEQNTGNYRTDTNGRARLRTRTGFYTPPSGHKLEGEMDSVLFENHCISEPIERAIHAHLHIARVHPLYDGNGRTSRLVQNIMLEHEGFFPAVLGPEDREEYLDVIADANDSYRNHQARINVPENRGYQRMKEILDSEELSLENGNEAVEITLELLRQSTTSKKNKFYDFIAGKLSETYDTELRRIKEVNSDKPIFSRKKSSSLTGFYN